MTLVQRRLLGLIVTFVAGVSGVLVAIWQTQKSERDARDKDAKAKVLAFADPAAARSLTLTTPAGTFALEREGTAAGKQAWTLTAPLRTPADTYTVDGLLRELAELKRTSTVNSDAAGDKKLFGLEPPRFTVSVTTAQGVTEILRAGKKNSFDGSLYAARDGAGEVVLVAGALEYQLDKDLFRLRDKRLLGIEPSEVVAAEVRVDGKPAYAFERQGENFVLTAPRVLPADTMQMNGLLSSLTSASATAFPVEQPAAADLARFGLAKPKAEAKLTLKGGSARTVLLSEVGDKDAKKHYATVAGEGPILELSSGWVFEKVAVEATSLRDLHVLPFTREDVATMTIKGGDKTLSFARQVHDGIDDWRMTSPKEAKAQDAVLTGLLYRLWNLKAGRILTENASETEKKARGLAPPSLTIELRKNDGSSLGTIAFGAVTGEEQYATAVGTSRIDVVDASVAKDIALEPAPYEEGTAQENTAQK